VLVTNLCYVDLICGSSGGLKGLFTGVGPRVARAGPSVGIVISCYEVVKYALSRRYNS
jgi:solute carrier family 25, member 39/40